MAATDSIAHSTGTLSGIALRPETMEEVARARQAMERFGLDVPEHVVMMLEVIGHESEKGSGEYERMAQFLPAQALNVTPFTSGCDFEFHIFPESADDKRKAEHELDKLAFHRIKEAFKDLPGINRLEPETISAYLDTQRHLRLGDAHNAKPFEVLKALIIRESDRYGHSAIGSGQYQLLEELCDGYKPHCKTMEQICGNLIYPGDLVIEKVLEEERASGHPTIQPDWPPEKRHETVAQSVVDRAPEWAGYGRFEVAIDHTADQGGKSPLAMIADYYNAQAHMREVAEHLANRHGIHFKPPERMVDHVHISNQKGMTLDSDVALKKAAGIVHCAEAMAPLLAAPSAFNRDTPQSGNMIHVHKIGYAMDHGSAFQEQRAYALRGVADDPHNLSRKGHFEFRLGNPRDPFNIVYMTATAAAGINASEHLGQEAVDHTASLLAARQPQTTVGQLDLNQALTGLIYDQRLNFMPPKLREALLASRLEQLEPEQTDRWNAHLAELSKPYHEHLDDKVEGRHAVNMGSVISAPALAESSEIRGASVLIISNEALSRKSLNLTKTEDDYPMVVVVPEARRQAVFNAITRAGDTGRDILPVLAGIAREEARMTIHPRSSHDIVRIRAAISEGRMPGDNVRFPVNQI